MRTLSLYMALLMFGLKPMAGHAGLVVSGLQCEQLTDPQGIDATHPRLSWRLEGEGEDIVQTAWQIMVASTPELLSGGRGDLWVSPKTAGDRSLMIPYGGVALRSGMSCYWKVRVWTNAGVTEWSASARWSMGLLAAADWKARWIGYDAAFSWDSISKFSRLSARYFRKEFASPVAFRRVTLYIAGLGHYLASVNGHPVGNRVLAQSPTDYSRSVKYDTYDVTADCIQGTNAIGVVLGNGRYFTMRPIYKPKKIKEFGFPKLLLQLDIEDVKGHHRTIVSDTSWKFTADGPIRANNEYDGEEYDATKEFGDWTKPGFDDSRWLRAHYAVVPGGVLSAQMDQPIRVMQTIAPIGIREQRPGVWILDMGQNMAGWLQLKVKGQRGSTIVLHYAETLRPDGDLYTANLRDAKATDTYTLKGEGREVWHPDFVFHGFRYVSVSGWPGAPETGDFEGQVVYDDLPTIGRISTSDTLLNHIIRNAWWGINSNYKGMPIDCPQRNERMPWLGDRATGSLGESYLFDNEALYAKWLDDIQESQKPDGSLPDVAPAYWNYYSDNMTWPGTYLLVADMLYEQFGDLAPVRRHYVSMKKWLWYMRDRYARDGLMTKDKYGDWCVPPESPQLIHTRDSTRITDGQLIATAYYYHFLRLMTKFAALLHEPDEYSSHATAVRKAFNNRFLHDEHYSNNTVTANLLPLCFGMVPKESRAAVTSRLIDRVASDGHISTGVIGTGWLMHGLTESGRSDLAFRLAVNKDYPGWGYMVRHGATTIWELWNGNTADPAMNSQNHVMLLGDLLTWCFRDLGGIAPAEPGYKKIRMEPVFPEGLDSVDATYETPYGEVKSAWRRSGTSITWDIEVPPNTQALVRLNGGDQEVGSGNYRFVSAHDVFHAVKIPKAAGAVLQSEFIYDTAPFPECHAATIAETPKGLVTAFFGGTKERNPDVCIYVSRKDKGSQKWTTPVNVANGIQNATLRYPCWNPVLYQAPGGPLLLFYKVGPSPSTWKGWLIRSSDGGLSWSKPEALPEGFLGPIKNQPVRLVDGTLVCPTSVEGHGWKVHFELTHDDAATWQMAAPVPAADSLRAIQPTILLEKDGTMLALCRSENRAILSTVSHDRGRTWSPLEPTSLPNNNSGIDGVTLADGRQLLVYNHVLPPPGETKGERSPLNVAVSPDGVDWYAALVLEDDHDGQYSYPTVIQSTDGHVHIVYTWRRKKIKYVEIDPSKLQLVKIENGVWPDSVKK